MPIEKLHPELDRIVSPDQAIEELGSGYGGANGPAEGPVWWKDGGYLLFSDIHNDRRMKWAEGEGVTTFSETTNQANGLTGTCRDASWRVSMRPAGSPVWTPMVALPWWPTATRGGSSTAPTTWS